MTGKLFVRNGTFPNTKRANRRLNKLWVKKELRKLGMVFIEDAWHCLFYCGPRFGRNMNQHHAEISAIKWAMDVDDFQRWDVEGEADGKITIKQLDGDLTLLLENDRDNENDKTVKDRVATLEKTGLSVLWVAPNDRRIRKLIRLTKPIADRCMYSTLSKVLHDPHAENAWVFADGTTGTLPKTLEDVLEDRPSTRGEGRRVSFGGEC